MVRVLLALPAATVRLLVGLLRLTITVSSGSLAGSPMIRILNLFCPVRGPNGPKVTLPLAHPLGLSSVGRKVCMMSLAPSVNR